MRRFSLLVLGIATATVMTMGAALAAPPASEVWETEQVTAHFEADSQGGYHYHLDIFAQRDGQGSLSMVLEVNVAVFGPNGDLIDECGDGGFVDPSLMEEFADDLSHVFLNGDGGSIGSDCFWESIFVDLHWDADGRILKGNSQQRDPGYRCSSHNERRSATVGNNIGLGNGPEGPTGPYENQVFNDQGHGEIFYAETSCQATGSPGPAG